MKIDGGQYLRKVYRRCFNNTKHNDRQDYVKCKREGLGRTYILILIEIRGGIRFSIGQVKGSGSVEVRGCGLGIKLDWKIQAMEGIQQWRIDKVNRRTN